MTSTPTIESVLIPSKVRVPFVREGTIRRRALVEAASRLGAAHHQRHSSGGLRQDAPSRPMGCGRLRAPSPGSRWIPTTRTRPCSSSTWRWLSSRRRSWRQISSRARWGWQALDPLLPALRAAAGHERPVRARGRRRPTADRSCARRPAPARSRHPARIAARALRPVRPRTTAVARLASQARRWSSRPAISPSTTRRRGAGREHGRRSVRRRREGSQPASVEGWAAGLYLCALAIRETGSLPDLGERAQRTASSPTTSSAELAALPEDQLDFLRESSVLTRMCPELCDAALSRADSRADAPAHRGIEPVPRPARPRARLVSLSRPLSSSTLTSARDVRWRARTGIRGRASEWCEERPARRRAPIRACGRR